MCTLHAEFIFRTAAMATTESQLRDKRAKQPLFATRMGEVLSILLSNTPSIAQSPTLSANRPDASNRIIASFPKRYMMYFVFIVHE
jgi:hypothetical protein